MRLVKPSIEFLSMSENPLQAIECAGRTCYKSEDAITESSSIDFVHKIMQREHLAMIEHAWTSYRVICDRGVTHEIVRHRLFSYAQESTRYCNYKGGVTFIKPPWIDLEECTIVYDDDFPHWRTVIASTSQWLKHLSACEQIYISLVVDRGWSPQQARSVLPNALKTEIVITGNLREWLHFFTLRTTKAAHPQMQEIANMILKDIRCRVSVIFDDVG